MKAKITLPPYAVFPSVYGETIALRQVMAPDIQDLIEISFYDAIQATSVSEASEMQAKIDGDYAEGNSIHWGIQHNATHKLIGTCGYYRGFDKESGELGCILLPQYQGQGYMSAAMKLAIDFGINTMGLKRIWAATSKENKKAIQLLERLNFTKIADLDDDYIEYELNAI